MQLARGQKPSGVSSRILRLVLASNQSYIKQDMLKITELKKSVKAKKEMNDEIHKVLRRRDKI